MTIDLINLTKIYGKRETKAIDSVSFEVCKGEILGLAGLNGAGKTTSIRISAGVIFPTSGDVLVDGVSIVSNKKMAALNIAWVPESPSVDPMQTPKSLFFEYGTYFGFDRSFIRDRMVENMHLAGLDDQQNKRIRTFSNGMRKRLMLALALFQNPDNYLLDETFAGLDPEGILLLKKILFKLKSQGKSILLSSHVLSELEEIVDRVVIIHKGRIVDTCNIRDIAARKLLEITVKGNAATAMHLLEPLGIVAEWNGSILLEPRGNASIDLKEVSLALEDNDIKLESVKEVKNGLERYFFEKIGKF